MSPYPGLAGVGSRTRQDCLRETCQCRIQRSAIVLQHDEQAVLTAVELALTEGVPTRTHVLNLLHRLVDGKVIGGPPLDTPQALILRREPKANVERYDGLRTQAAGGRHAS